MRAALANRYATVHPFLSMLGESKALARRKVGVKPLLPREVDDKLVPPAWRRAVYANPDLPQGAMDRDAYVVCVLEQLHRALNNRDVFASPSHRWSNPRALLLSGLSLAQRRQRPGRGYRADGRTRHPRDSLHILDALLNLDGGAKPEMVATDNASYSDMVFGLFKILGYNFSPGFRGLDDQRFWRATMPCVEAGTYGAVEDLARNRVNLNKVITHWPDMLKVAGSLVTNQVRAYDLLRMFGCEGRPTPLGVAVAEYGQIAKTEHLLRVVDPDAPELDEDDDGGQE